jgi:hypothetical protein
MNDAPSQELCGDLLLFTLPEGQLPIHEIKDDRCGFRGSLARGYFVHLSLLLVSYATFTAFLRISA